MFCGSIPLILKPLEFQVAFNEHGVSAVPKCCCPRHKGSNDGYRAWVFLKSYIPRLTWHCQFCLHCTMNGLLMTFAWNAFSYDIKIRSGRNDDCHRIITISKTAMDIRKLAWSQLSDSCKLNENKWFHPAAIMENPKCINVQRITRDQLVYSLIHDQSNTWVRWWWTSHMWQTPLKRLWIHSCCLNLLSVQLWPRVILQMRSWKIRPYSLLHIMDEAREK